MRRALLITDKSEIETTMHEAEYGVLALYGSDKNKTPAPYAVPVNFAYLDGSLYFHTTPKGKKMRLIADNPQVSFNVVTEPIIIPSFFSSDSGLACPASCFFKSITIDGIAEIIESRAEMDEVFELMMRNLQPEGGYKLPLSDQSYDMEYKALVMVKIPAKHISAKFKFGQTLTDERFNMVMAHLRERGTDRDLQTVAMMERYKKQKPLK